MPLERITGPMIDDASVTGADVQDGTLTGADVQDGSIAGADIQDGSVTGGDIQDGSVDTADLVNSAVTTAKLADSAVTTAKLANGSVTRAKTGESLINLATLQAATSGTTKDFTGIPSWARRVVILFNGVSSTGANDILIQLGVGTTPTTTGYQNSQSTLSYPSGIVNTTSTAGIPIFNNLGSYVFTGRIVLELLDSTANTWIVSGHLMSTVTTLGTVVSGGVITLSGSLGMVRLTTTTGTPTFDAGSVNISWE